MGTKLLFIRKLKLQIVKYKTSFQGKIVHFFNVCQMIGYHEPNYLKSDISLSVYGMFLFLFKGEKWYCDFIFYYVSYFNYALFKTFHSGSWSQLKKKKNCTDQFLLRSEINNKFTLKHSNKSDFIYIGFKDFFYTWENSLD